ncbi:protein mono-ADP-ribosyltransferase PARP9 [Genypterus blacodes]|uniref:protein mono-ADP-ribosyltransferase PARP9 n=1 Tax=Genypterus blacodes TaxID=154954 RepID=UPI003F7711E8
MASKSDIPLHGASVNIVKRCGPVLENVLQSKFGCVAKIHGVDFERDPSAARHRPTVQHEERYAVVLPAGVKVSVWKADLTSFQVDGVVNAANDLLQHYGGLASALSEAGGPDIQSECDEVISQRGTLKTGDTAVTKAGRLPCKMIIHAVGPKLPSHPLPIDVSHAAPLLKRAVRNILDTVEIHHLQSVAIPALSSGLFNFPLQRCAEIIVETVKDHYAFKSSFPVPQEVRLANHDELTVNAMEAACRQLLGPPPMYSQAVANPRGGASNASPHKVQLGGISLTLKKGKIEEQQADVIVNTVGSRDLSVGEISKALSQKAGREMQNEMYKCHGSDHVLFTKGYNLRCKQVFHTVCTASGGYKATMILSKAVTECLWMAVSNKHKSIAFPAIGTGNLGISRKEAAQIMADAVVEFAQKFPETLDVYFIIFPRDYQTFEAFEHQMRSLHAKSSLPSTSHGFELRTEPGSRAPGAQISLSSNTDESTREAERWLSSLLDNSHGTVVIRNNFVQYFGKREFQQLSRESAKGVAIEEFYHRGSAGLMLRGNSAEDLVVVAMQVEAMLCEVQREFVKEEERAMTPYPTNERKTMERFQPAYTDRMSPFKDVPLKIVRVDKVEIPALKKMFELKRKQMVSKKPSQRMYQRVPAQFCSMVCQIGFHAEYAPPDDPAFGDGIYFTRSVRSALKTWKDLAADEEYQYFVEAEVLTGNATAGKPDLITPPAVGQDPSVVFDSLNGPPDISVVFSGYQALPQYIIICKKI